MSIVYAFTNASVVMIGLLIFNLPFFFPSNVYMSPAWTAYDLLQFFFVLSAF